jgi:bla regulator protein blaR1
MTNHLWQSTIFAVAAGFLTLAFRRNRAQVRYWLWFSASLKFLIPFSLLMSLGSYVKWTPAARTIAMPVLSSTMVQFTQPFPETVSFVPSTTDTPDWIPMTILGTWACGFAAVALMRLRGWLRVRSVVRASSPLELPVPVEVRSSPGLLEPGVVGFLRPILLLPEGIAEYLTPRQLEAVLEHELCHVRRRDNLTSAIHMLVEAIFWFHPLVWWIGARLVDERERACDEAVLSLGNEPQIYAEGILNVCKIYVGSPLRYVSGVTGSDLKRRIQAILTERVAVELNFARRVALAVAGIAVITLPVIVGIMNAPAIRAQSPAVTPKFEVASIKPDLEHGGMAVRPLPGRLIADASVRLLMQNAYAVPPFQIEGGPAWVDSERYAVDAKAGGNANRAQIFLMLQSLLEDRFQLKTHRETRELPVYTLVAARGGLKLPPPKEGGCVNPDADAPPDWAEGRMAGRMPPPQPGKPPSPRCGSINVMLAASGARMQGGKLPMPEFVRVLSTVLGRTVIDKSGFTGLFDVQVDFVPDETTPALPAPPPGAAPLDFNGPSILTAMQQQLGLRLESSKGPVEVIIVDYIERPSAN